MTEHPEEQQISLVVHRIVSRFASGSKGGYLFAHADTSDDDFRSSFLAFATQLKTNLRKATGGLEMAIWTREGSGLILASVYDRKEGEGAGGRPVETTLVVLMNSRKRATATLGKCYAALIFQIQKKSDHFTFDRAKSLLCKWTSTSPEPLPRLDPSSSRRARWVNQPDGWLVETDPGVKRTSVRFTQAQVQHLKAYGRTVLDIEEFSERDYDQISSIVSGVLHPEDSGAGADRLVDTDPGLERTTVRLTQAQVEQLKAQAEHLKASGRIVLDKFSERDYETISSIVSRVLHPEDSGSGSGSGAGAGSGSSSGSGSGSGAGSGSKRLSDPLAEYFASLPSDPSLEDALKRTSLEVMAPVLERLGVRSLEGVRFVESEDFESDVLPAPVRRRFEMFKKHVCDMMVSPEK